MPQPRQIYASTTHRRDRRRRRRSRTPSRIGAVAALCAAARASPPRRSARSAWLNRPAGGSDSGKPGQRRVVRVEVVGHAERLVVDLGLAAAGGRRRVGDVRVVGGDRGLVHAPARYPQLAQAHPTGAGPRGSRRSRRRAGRSPPARSASARRRPRCRSAWRRGAGRPRPRPVADVEPARLEVGRVRRRGQLAEALLPGQPRLAVVLLGRRGAEVGHGDVDDAVGDPERGEDLLLVARAAARARRARPRARRTRTSRPCRTGARGRCRACRAPRRPASRRKQGEKPA